MQVPFYWAAQFTGAMCAAFVLKAVLHPITVIGTTTPTGPHWHALVIEIVVTFNMMFVTCAVATDSRAVSTYLAIAFNSFPALARFDLAFLLLLLLLPVALPSPCYHGSVFF